MVYGEMAKKILDYVNDNNMKNDLIEKFWKWMKDNYFENWSSMNSAGNLNELTIIGYMYEYINELLNKIIIKKKWDKLDDLVFGDIIRQQLPIKKIEKAFFQDSHYQALVNIIKELEEL